MCGGLVARSLGGADDRVARYLVITPLGGADDRVDALEVFRLEDERAHLGRGRGGVGGVGVGVRDGRADLGLAVLLRVEADDHLGRLPRATVHRALGGRDAELDGRVGGEAAPGRVVRVAG
eukprot:scaffold27687_cov38-Phaeocystis_antarctica.AAC.1